MQQAGRPDPPDLALRKADGRREPNRKLGDQLRWLARPAIARGKDLGESVLGGIRREAPHGDRLIASR